MDVASAAQVAATVDDTVKRWGRLDWAVNAAALSDDLRPARTADITEQEWDQTIAADLKGVWLAMKYELPAMIETGEARLSTSSVNVCRHAVGRRVPSSACTGCRRLPRWSTPGTASNIVCPGAHHADAAEGVRPPALGALTRRPRCCARIPMHRIKIRWSALSDRFVRRRRTTALC
jgi:NAD(P)-dependent dehydrogenase (short-subunit alcohol dehydrogenase family)